MLLRLCLIPRKTIHDQHPEKKFLIGLQITEIFEKTTKMTYRTSNNRDNRTNDENDVFDSAKSGLFLAFIHRLYGRLT